MANLARINGSGLEDAPRTVEGELLAGKSEDFNDCPTPEATDRAIGFLAQSILMYIRRERMKTAQAYKAISEDTQGSMPDESSIV
jgi:hypothetical protein